MFIKVYLFSLMLFLTSLMIHDKFSSESLVRKHLFGRIRRLGSKFTISLYALKLLLLCGVKASYCSGNYILLVYFVFKCLCRIC